MHITDWKKDVFTIPNILSFSRILMIPIYIAVYLRAAKPKEYMLAGVILTLSCVTDAIDGIIARHLGMITQLGKLLDPVADKLTQLALFLCLSLKFPAIWPVLALFIVKESFQISAAVVYYRRGKALPGALLVGKICTAVLFLSMISLVLFPSIPKQFVNQIALIDSAFLCVSFVGYIGAYWGKRPLLEDLNQ